MEFHDGFMVPFKDDRPRSKRVRGKWVRRTPTEQERTICIGPFVITYGVWDKDDWLELTERPYFYGDFGDIVVAFSFSRWPGDWPP